VEGAFIARVFPGAMFYSASTQSLDSLRSSCPFRCIVLGIAIILFFKCTMDALLDPVDRRMKVVKRGPVVHTAIAIRHQHARRLLYLLRRQISGIFCRPESQ
jgi:hypothetical protein